MRTVATFGWLNVSLKLPLTTWVNHYVDYFRHEWRPQQRLDWLAAGHEYFWYLACSIVGLSIIIYFEILVQSPGGFNKSISRNKERVHDICNIVEP